MRATSPGNTTAVQSGSSMIAGPVMVEPAARAWRSTILRVGVAARLGEPGLAHCRACALGGGLSPAECRAAAARGHGRHQRPVHRLDRALGIQKLVLAQIGPLECVDGLPAIAVVYRARRQIDMDLEPLPGISHLRVSGPLRFARLRDPLHVLFRQSFELRYTPAIARPDCVASRCMTLVSVTSMRGSAWSSPIAEPTPAP